jgi:hypothetical protein
MCPVRACAELVHQIDNSNISPDKIPDLKINTIIINNKLFTIPSKLILDRIRAAIKDAAAEMRKA